LHFVVVVVVVGGGGGDGFTIRKSVIMKWFELQV